MNIKKKIKYMLSTAGSFGLLATVATVAAGETTSDSSTNTTTSTKQEITYNIFPEVQNIKYTDGSISITPEVNLVFENGIDAATIARFDQVLKLRNLTYTKSRNIVSGKTNILVGIKGDTDTLVDDELKTLGITPDATLDNKLDSYMLNAGTFNNGSYITLLAKDATAAFYGVTTLWHIFNQLDGFKIRNLTIKDYADLKVRGVSDAYFWNTYTDLGYYTTNNRWNSADDIIEFMKYASFYKLNTFIFRPDDLILSNIDSKNSASKWHELYTETEINKFKEVLAASKESKVQFDFSFNLLKSFDVSNDTDYKTQFDLLTKKMTQMLQIGVRQFSVVSRGVVVAHENYITKLFVDLIQWLKQQKQTYTDLNTNMLFFGRYGEYSLSGKSDQLNYYHRLPEEVTPLLIHNPFDWFNQQIKENTYLDAYSGDIKLNPVFWKVAPAFSDSLQRTIFVREVEKLVQVDHTQANKFNGIILATPNSSQVFSQFGFFDLANQAWKLPPATTNTDDYDAYRDRIFNGAIKSVINHKLLTTPESNAFKSLRMHYQSSWDNQYFDSTDKDDALKPSADKLYAELTKNNPDADLVENNNLVSAAEDFVSKIRELEVQNRFLENNAIQSEYLKEISSFVSALRDYFKASEFFAEAIVELFSSNPNFEAVSIFKDKAEALYKQATSYVYKSKTISIGSKNLKVVVDAMRGYITSYLDRFYNPHTTKIQETIVSNRYDSGNNDTDDIQILTKNNQSYYRLKYTSFGKQLGTIDNGDYFGLKFSAPKDITNLRVKFRGSQNQRQNLHYFLKFKVQYKLFNSTDFIDLTGDDGNIKEFTAGWNNNVQKVEFDDIQINKQNVQEIRILDTETNPNIRTGWFDIYEFLVNTSEAKSLGGTQLAIISETNSSDSANELTHNNDKKYKFDNIKDALFDTNNTYNNVEEGKIFSFQLQETNPQDVYSVVIQQTPGYFLDNADLEYKDENETDASKQWKVFGHLARQRYQVLFNKVKTKHFRIKNKSTKTGDWILRDIAVFGPEKKYLFTDNDTQKSNLYTFFNDINKYSVYATGNTEITPSGSTEKMQVVPFEQSKYYGLDLKDVYNLTSIKFNGNTTIPNDVVLETSSNGELWVSYTGQLTEDNANARFVRVRKKVTTDAQQSSSTTTQFGSLDVSVQPGNEYGRLINSNIAIKRSWGDNRFDGNEFDGDFSTESRFGGAPLADDFIIYDLGSQIDLDTLKFYAKGGTLNFPRHFKVYVSDNLDARIGSQWTEVFDSDSALTNEQRNQTPPNNLEEVKDPQWYQNKVLLDPVYKNWVHIDPNHPELRYWLADNIRSKRNSQKSRYIKIVFQQSMDNTLIKDNGSKGSRAVSFVEILPNDLTYIPPYDPRFNGEKYHSNSAQTGTAKLVDGDFSTYYQPAQTNGTLKYYINPEDFKDKNLAIVSDGTADDVVVKKLVFDINTKETTTEDLGILAFNDMTFDLTPETNKQLIGFELVWTDKKPKIFELTAKNKPVANTGSTTETTQNTPTKESLKTAITTTPENFENWTVDSQKRYNTVKAQVEKLANSKYPLSADTLKTLQRSLNDAKEGVVKVNDQQVSSLQKLIISSNLFSNESYIQDANYAQYKGLIETAKNALLPENRNNFSSEFITNLENQIKAQQQNVAFSTYDEQVAENNLAKVTDLNPKHYTPETYAKLTEEVAKLKEKIKQGQATPADFVGINTQFTANYQQLQKSETGIAYDALQEQLKAAQQFVFDNGDKFPDQVKQVQQQIAQLQDVLNNKDADIQQLQNATKQIKTSTDNAVSQKQQAFNNFEQLIQNQIANKNDIYTPESYQAYSDAINKAKVKLDASDTLTNEEILDLQNQIQLAQNQLTIASDKVEAAKSNVEPLVTQLESPEIQKQYQELLKAATTPEKLAKAINDINIAIKDQKVEKETLKDQVQRDIDSIKDPEKKAELQKEFDTLKASNATNDKFSEFRSQTLAESLKSIFKSQQSTNNADATKDKPENPESKPTNPTNQQPSKSKNTAIIVISVLIALAVIGGLIGAWFAARSIKKKKANK